MGNPSPDEWAYVPSYEGEERDQIAKINERKEKIKAKELTFKGKKYAFDPKTRFIYDLDSYLQGNPRKIGKLVTKGKNQAFVLFKYSNISVCVSHKFFLIFYYLL